MMKNIRTVKALIDKNWVAEKDRHDLEKVVEQFSVAIPSSLVSAIEQENKGPLYKQFVPTAAELIQDKSEQTDPIGDQAFEVVKGVIHRYPDRCLLLPLKACPVYCRFCFRRETVAKSKSTLSPSELKTALNYIATHPKIWEVILTGGDPLFLKSKTIKNIFSALEEIPHVEVIRIHSRVPVLDPDRIQDDLLQALQTSKALYIGLHANHPNEFTKAAEMACAKLVNAGIPMLSQTVLLKGINDNVETLAALMKIFVKNRIKPYYLHHGDLAPGTSHFRTTFEAGQALMKALRGRYSGLCQPMYVLDIPGGFGKVPICAEYIEALQNQVYKIKDYQGMVHEYPPKTEY